MQSVIFVKHIDDLLTYCRNAETGSKIYILGGKKKTGTRNARGKLITLTSHLRIRFGLRVKTKNKVHKRLIATSVDFLFLFFKQDPRGSAGSVIAARTLRERDYARNFVCGDCRLLINVCAKRFSPLPAPITQAATLLHLYGQYGMAFKAARCCNDVTGSIVRPERGNGSHLCP